MLPRCPGLLCHKKLSVVFTLKNGKTWERPITNHLPKLIYLGFCCATFGLIIEAASSKAAHVNFSSQVQK